MERSRIVRKLPSLPTNGRPKNLSLLIGLAASGADVKALLRTSDGENRAGESRPAEALLSGIGGRKRQAANHDVVIRERAYAIWEEEGRPHGRDWDHWLRAAQEIGSTPKQVTTPAAKGRKPAARKGGFRQALKSALS
jgi:hypothetical protein